MARDSSNRGERSRLSAFHWAVSLGRPDEQYGAGMENGTGPRRPIPFQAPGQGNNPNTALTRPQAMNPLTLVGSWLAV